MDDGARAVDWGEFRGGGGDGVGALEPRASSGREGSRDDAAVMGAGRIGIQGQRWGCGRE